MIARSQYGGDEADPQGASHLEFVEHDKAQWLKAYLAARDAIGEVPGHHAHWDRAAPDHVYVVGWDGGLWSKVGRTTNMRSRLRSLQSGNHRRLYMEWWRGLPRTSPRASGSPSEGVERAIIRGLVAAGVPRGGGGCEWFRMAYDDMAYLVESAIDDARGTHSEVWL
jgi:hypothetical protein